jgi:hypothetical protein
VTDLNADLLDGKDWRSPDPIGNITPNSVAATTLSSSGLAILQSARITNLTPSMLVSTDGSNNLVSTGAITGVVPATPNTLVQRDAYGNVFCNNSLMNTLNIVTAGGTTNLSNSTPNQILLTGNLNQILKFPVPGPAGYVVGTEFRVNNDATAGVVTVQENGAVVIGTVPAGGLGVVILTSTAGNGTWQIHAIASSLTTWGTALLSTPSAIKTTDATQSTSTATGSIQTAGGLGVVKDVWIGGNLNVAGTFAGGGFTTTRWNHAQSTWIAGVATTLALVNSGYGLVAQFNGPGVPALNDEFRTVAFQIVPGTYTLNVVSSTLNNRGIANFYLDASGVSFGSIDLYNNAGLGTVVLTVAGVVIPASTNNSHSLRVVVTKNGLSGGYFITLGAVSYTHLRAHET